MWIRGPLVRCPQVRGPEQSLEAAGRQAVDQLGADCRASDVDRAADHGAADSAVTAGGDPGREVPGYNEGCMLA